MTYIIDAEGRIKRVATVNDHAHSAPGDGGQLDWDVIWADAAHDHSSAAEGDELDVQANTILKVQVFS